MKGRILIWSMLAVSLSLVLFSCATTGPAFEPVPPEQRADGGSVIYLYRPKAFGGAAVKFNLTINSTDEVALTNGSYYPYVCEPGDYTVTWTVGRDTLTASLTVEEGQAKYVRAKVKVTTFILFTMSKNYLDVVDTDTAQEEIAECSLLE
jgi:hypothetical protein